MQLPSGLRQTPSAARTPPGHFSKLAQRGHVTLEFGPWRHGNLRGALQFRVGNVGFDLQQFLLALQFFLLALFLFIGVFVRLLKLSLLGGVDFLLQFQIFQPPFIEFFQRLLPLQQKRLLLKRRHLASVFLQQRFRTRQIFICLGGLRLQPAPFLAQRQIAFVRRHLFQPDAPFLGGDLFG